MANYSTSVWCQVLSQDIASNTSVVRIHFQFVRTDYSCFGYNSATYWDIWCYGQHAAGNWATSWNIPQNQWTEVAYADFRVDHASNGQKAVGYSATLNFNGVSPGSLSASSSTGIPTIPRYFTSTPSLTLNSVTQTEANFSWGTSETCNFVRVHLNDSTYHTDNPGTVNGRSGDFRYLGHYDNNVSNNAANPTISTLAPGTTYRLKAECRRSDSGLWSYSANTTFTTSPIASISTPSIDFNIGQSLTVQFQDYTANASYLKFYAKNESDEWVLITSTTETITSESYTLNLSTTAIVNRLYSLCPHSNTLEVKLVCGTTINEVDYNNETCGAKTEMTGIATVVNSDPTFTAFTISNNDSKSNSIIGSTYMMSGLGNMVAYISLNDSMVTKNYATPNVYRVTYGLSNNARTVDIPYINTNIQIPLGAFEIPDIGYFVRIEAIDSRGNSASVTKGFIVLPYHTPILNAEMARYNNFEKEIFLELDSSVSRLTIGNADKNYKVSLSYKVRNNGSVAWGASTEVPTSDIITSISGTNIVYDIIKNTPTNKFIDLDIEKSYDILFTLSDRYTSTELLVFVPQGVAIMEIRDDGTVLVGLAPDDFSDNNKMRIASDIVLRDRNRNDGALLENIGIISAEEPTTQLNGCFWFDTSEDIIE